MEAEDKNTHCEWWAHPSDGRLVPLVLQCGDEPHLLPETTRWARLGKPTSRVIYLLRVSYWIGSSIFEPGSQTYRLNLASLSIVALKLIVAWPLLCILVCSV